MAHKTVTIFDGERNVVATADVELLEGYYLGSVNLDRMPEPLRLKFEEYEEIVNNQIFGLLDQIEEQIGVIPFAAVFEDGCELSIRDLQIFPEGGTIFFKAAEPAMLNR